MSVEETSGGAFYMDQAALDNPPAAPSKYMFIVPAIAHVGRVRIPDWNDAERTSLVEGEDAARAGIDAIQSAAKLLHQAIMDDDVTIYSRPSSGGALTAMPTADWINDYTGVNIARSSGGPAVHGSVYLFVERSELEKKFVVTPPDAGDQRHADIELSPYLRLMIEVAEKQGISADNHSTTDSLEADLLAEAHRFGLSVGSTFSKTFAGELAKAIRWPIARLGKAMGANHKS